MLQRYQCQKVTRFMIACCRLRRFANPRALALPTSLRASDLNPPTSRQRSWGNLGMIGLSSLSAPPLERKLSNVPTSTVDRDSANQTRRRIVDYLICVVTDVGIPVDGSRSSPTPYSDNPAGCAGQCPVAVHTDMGWAGGSCWVFPVYAD